MYNCSQVANPNQRDSDNDGYGNICGSDTDGHLIVNTAYLAHFKSKFFTSVPDADPDGNGIVNVACPAILKSMYLKLPVCAVLRPDQYNLGKTRTR